MAHRLPALWGLVAVEQVHGQGQAAAEVFMAAVPVGTLLQEVL
jgi:hypothetical protein